MLILYLTWFVRQSYLPEFKLFITYNYVFIKLNISYITKFTNKIYQSKLYMFNEKNYESLVFPEVLCSYNMNIVNKTESVVEIVSLMRAQGMGKALAVGLVSCDNI